MRLFVFIIAVVNTNMFGEILILMASYYFSKFSNPATKRAGFNFVEFHVLTVILCLMIFQALFKYPMQWSRIVGWRRVEMTDSRVILYLTVSLWILTKIYERVYETENFIYIVRNIKESEAIHGIRALDKR